MLTTYSVHGSFIYGFINVIICVFGLQVKHVNKYNSAKSNVMIFCCKIFKDINIPNCMLNSETLPRVSKCIYLDHFITDLSDNDDMSRQYKRIYAQGNAQLDPICKSSLCKSYCTSLYTCQLCCHYRAETIRKQRQLV